MVDEHARAGPPRPVRAFEGAAAHARHAGHSPGAARPARRSLDAPRHTSQHAADAHGGGGIPASGSNRGSGSSTPMNRPSRKGSRRNSSSGLFDLDAALVAQQHATELARRLGSAAARYSVPYGMPAATAPAEPLLPPRVIGRPEALSTPSQARVTPLAVDMAGYADTLFMSPPAPSPMRRSTSNPDLRELRRLSSPLAAPNAVFAVPRANAGEKGHRLVVGTVVAPATAATAANAPSFSRPTFSVREMGPICAFRVWQVLGGAMLCAAVAMVAIGAAGVESKAGLPEVRWGTCDVVGLGDGGVYATCGDIYDPGPGRRYPTLSHNFTAADSSKEAYVRWLAEDGSLMQLTCLLELAVRDDTNATDAEFSATELEALAALSPDGLLSESEVEAERRCMGEAERFLDEGGATPRGGCAALKALPVAGELPRCWGAARYDAEVDRVRNFSYGLIDAGVALSFVALCTLGCSISSRRRMRRAKTRDGASMRGAENFMPRRLSQEHTQQAATAATATAVTASVAGMPAAKPVVPTE